MPTTLLLVLTLPKLNTRHHWKWKFEDGFEVAVRKSAIPIPAPKCRMDYLILTIPSLYPESPQASPAERHDGRGQAVFRWIGQQLAQLLAFGGLPGSLLGTSNETPAGIGPARAYSPSNS